MEGSQHDSASVIRGVMIQKKEALGLINRFAAVHLPHKHNLLPNDILARIFVLVAQDYGAVAFPMFKTENLPQLAVSHACSHWHIVALRTSSYGTTRASSIPKTTFYQLSTFNSNG